MYNVGAAGSVRHGYEREGDVKMAANAENNRNERERK
jgi:hypothetical protein